MEDTAQYSASLPYHLCLLATYFHCWSFTFYHFCELSQFPSLLQLFNPFHFFHLCPAPIKTLS